MDEFDQKMEISEQPQEEIVEKIPGRDVYETVSSLVSALLVVVLVFTFLVRLMGVSGPSMIPTLQDGDRLLVVNSLLCGDYQVGDIVIARKETFDSKPIVKRVIATHVGMTPEVGQQNTEGTLEVNLLPQGTLAECIRAGGAGLGGVLTPVGIDTLVEYDNRGKIREGLATTWEWDADTLTWTFHLRDENWVDCNGEVLGPVTAQDFVDALQYVLTPAYASSTASLVTPYVAGAEDYYNYLFYKASAENGTVAEDGTTYTLEADGSVTAAAADGTTTSYAPVDFDTVGVKAVDEHTLTYTLCFDFPGFVSLLSYAPYEPAYGPLLEEFADQFCTSAETACSCGAFYLAEYVPLESWVMKKNPENYDKDNVYIDTIRYIYNQEELISGPEMVRRGEIDQATISSDILDSWLSDDTTKDMVSMDRPNTNYTYFYMFNFMPFSHEFSNWSVEGMDADYEPENWAKAINNTNFRKSFLYGINNSVTLAVKAPEGYDNYKLNTITPPSFCANADGVDYLKCGDLANITEFFDEAKAKEYRDAAVEELTAAGATFPIKVQYPYNPAVVDWDKQCQVFKQQVEGVLNDGFDFINIIITQGPSDNFLNAVRRVGAYELMSYYWGADYSDPETEVYPFYQEAGDRGTCYAFLRTGVEDGIITGETAEYVMTYMSMVEKAKAITEDLDARYEAFANAEAYLIQNALVVPLGLPVPPYIATRLNLWEGQYAPTGLSSNRLKGVHILDHYVSMDEYDQNRDAR